jgi:hypothetical protein
MERACIPSNLGPPDAIVEQVELCLEGPAIAGRLELRRAATSSGSQWRTTVIRPLLSMIFQDGIWSCRPSVYKVSQTIVGMASITARNKIFFFQYMWEILWKNGMFYIYISLNIFAVFAIFLKYGWVHNKKQHIFWSRETVWPKGQSQHAYPKAKKASKDLRKFNL